MVTRPAKVSHSLTLLQVIKSGLLHLVLQIDPTKCLLKFRTEQKGTYERDVKTDLTLGLA